MLVTAGYTKLFDLGLPGLREFFASMGIPLPGLTGPFVALLELVGGVGLMLGVYARVWSALFAIQFTVVAFYVHLPQGWEAMWVPLLLLAAAVLFVIEGSGPASFDAVMAARRARLRPAGGS